MSRKKLLSPLLGIVVFGFLIISFSGYDLSEAFGAVSFRTDIETQSESAEIVNDFGGFSQLAGATAVTTVVIGSDTYAIAVSSTDDSVTIINITERGSPTLVAEIVNDAGGFTKLEGARSVTTVVIGSNTYALVGAETDNSVTIINITTPGSPTLTAEITDGAGGFEELAGAAGITTAVIGATTTYALVASIADSGFTIIDISTPGTPTLKAEVSSCIISYFSF